MYFVPEGQQDRSLARSAWTAPPQQSRPVGYGMIVEVCAPIRRLEDEISNAVSVSRIEIENPKFIGGILYHVRHLVSVLPVG
jgi:hypothetical protein